MILEILIILGIIYCIVDFVTGVYYKRCVMPGLKCAVCRGDS